MLALCIVAVALSLVSTSACAYLLYSLYQTDQFLAHIAGSAEGAFQEHGRRLSHLELSLGGVYGPFGYQKAVKA